MINAKGPSKSHSPFSAPGREPSSLGSVVTVDAVVARAAMTSEEEVLAMLEGKVDEAGVNSIVASLAGR